jgi:hypothetical protein
VAAVSEPAQWKPGVEWWLQSRAARNLEAIVTGNTPLLPTPAVNDMGAGKTPEAWDEWTDAMRARHGNGNGHGKSLEIEAQRLLPTPAARDHKGPNPNQRTGGVDLPTALLPTPRATWEPTWHDFGPYAAAIRRWEAVIGRPAPSPTEPGANDRPRLSPRFVEWMMGLPDGWVTGVDIPRSAQLKALGNGVVPQQAALALAMLDGDGAAMSEQRGLRNPDTHGTTSDGEPYCESCGVCDEGWRCRCCLAAEVAALRAQVQRVRDVLSGAYINMTPPQITTNVYGDAGLVIAVTDVEYALEGDDA